MGDQQKPVLIAGAGLASLLFARALVRHKIPFLIFERDASMDFRGQGYRLRLSDVGLEAIESVLDPKAYEEFYEVCGKTQGSGLVALDARTGAPEEDITTEKLTSKAGYTVGIARGELREQFMKGCEPFVRWNHKVTGYELTQGGVVAVFADGTKSQEGALLVGGEGIYSKVAKQVSGGKLKTFDTGARGIHGQAPTSAFRELGEGVFRLVDKTRPDGSVFVITNVRGKDMDDPNKVFGWTMGGQPGVIKAPNDNYSIVGKAAADIAKEITKDWHPRFKPLFDQMNENEAAFWKITCSSPKGVPEWENCSRVTVIGDAVHSMTPAGGNGANNAMKDSAVLGKLVAEAGGWKEGLTAEYETIMRVYGGEAVAQSYGMATKQFGIGELRDEV